MNIFFSFRFEGYGSDKLSELAIFFSGSPRQDEIIKAIKDDVERNLVPSCVFLILPEAYVNDARNVIGNASFKAEFDALVGSSDEKLRRIFFNGSGGLIEGKGVLDDDVKRGILQAGILEIFRRRKGLITSSENYHFVKPSGDHCNAFIRASNLLISSTEVSFLAVSLLPYLNEGVKRIYIDTSSIAYLVMTALKISGRYNERDVVIDSFESYTAFDKPYDFIAGKESLVIISATASGNLAKKLIGEYQFANYQIVTLFGQSNPDGQNIVCNIKSVLPGSIKTTSAKDCDLCVNGSRTINISGDQFLPDTPKHESRIIRKADLSAERDGFLSEFAAKGILGWRKSVCPSDGAPEHFYIDVEKALSTEVDFTKDIDRVIKRYVSRHVNVVVALDDSESTRLAERICKEYTDIEMVVSKDLDEERIKTFQSVVVVAGAITSGRKLLSVSRSLRALSEAGSIKYLVAFSKLPGADALKQLRRDLAQGGNDFCVVRSFALPRIKEYSKNAWDFEVEVLRAHTDDDPLNVSGTKLPTMLQRRLDFLISDEVDSNSLFLKEPSGGDLRLRKTFAFWSDIKLDALKATQADVYWTIQAVLHDLRSQPKGGGLSSIYHTTLISPVCFDRFNDGVIQSCLLRAASQSELNYSIDADCSRQMTDIIVSVITNHSSEQGEASLEFLMALLAGRLRLSPAHLQEIVQLDFSGFPEEMAFLFAQLKAGSSLESA